MTREWAFGQDTDLTISECEWGIPYAYNSSDLYGAVERLTRERDQLQNAMALHAGDCMSLSNEADLMHDHWQDAESRCATAERKVERLRDLVQTLIDNAPDDPISDAGHTVLDLWRHEARAALKETSDE